MRLFFIFVTSIDSVINFRVTLEEVHCGSNEVIFSQAKAQPGGVLKVLKHPP